MVARTTSQTHVLDGFGVVASTMVLEVDPTRPPQLKVKGFLLCQQSIFVCYGRSLALGGKALRGKEYESSKVIVSTVLTKELHVCSRGSNKCFLDHG